MLPVPVPSLTALERSVLCKKIEIPLNCFFSQIGAEENKAHAAAVYPIVNKYLGVAEDRMYILFNDASYQNMGWKGTTFAAILGK